MEKLEEIIIQINVKKDNDYVKKIKN